jgi:hypothetical protein
MFSSGRSQTWHGRLKTPKGIRMETNSSRARAMLSVGLFGVAIGGGLATSKLDPHTARHLAILCAIVSVLLAHDVRQLIWGDTQSK